MNKRIRVAAVFFRLVTGLDALVHIAIVATVLQWIPLTEALGPRSKPRGAFASTRS